MRGTRLADSMNDYLIRVIDQTPNTCVRLHTEVIDSHGSARLEGLTVHDRQTGATELVPAALSVLISATSSTGWLASQRQPVGPSPKEIRNVEMNPQVLGAGASPRGSKSSSRSRPAPAGICP